jgi:thiamine kinase-like enzyme
MKYCGWWFQIKFVVQMYWSTITEILCKKPNSQLENDKRASYNDQHFPKEF